MDNDKTNKQTDKQTNKKQQEAKVIRLSHSKKTHNASDVQQPLQGMELQEKEEKDEKHIGKLFKENTKKKRCLVTLHWKPFRLLVEGKHSALREFQSLAVKGKKLLTETSLKHLGMTTEKSCNLFE